MNKLMIFVLLLGAFLFGAVDQRAGGSRLNAADPAASPRESAEMAIMRKKAKERRRRLIYNNDGNDMSGQIHENPESFLSQRTIPALNKCTIPASSRTPTTTSPSRRCAVTVVW